MLGRLTLRPVEVVAHATDGARSQAGIVLWPHMDRLDAMVALGPGFGDEGSELLSMWHWGPCKRAPEISEALDALADGEMPIELQVPP